MKSITSSLPLELVGNDFLHYNPCSGDYKFLLVITDHFKRFVQAYPTTKCKSSSWEGIQRFHNVPEKFEIELFQRLSKHCGIKKIFSTPYHSQTNGQVKQMNETILKYLPEQYKSIWRYHINNLVHACNTNKSSATGYYPYYLSFYSHPRLPIGVILLSPNYHSV